MDQPADAALRSPDAADESTNKKFLIGGSIIAVALIGLMFWAMNRPESTAFYLTTSEVAARGRTTGADQYRVNGNVVPGSVRRDGLRSTFAISDGHTQMEITTDRPLPDAFQDSAETQIVALGTFNGRFFTASEVLAKCPSKFKARA